MAYRILHRFQFPDDMTDSEIRDYGEARVLADWFDWQTEGTTIGMAYATREAAFLALSNLLMRYKGEDASGVQVRLRIVPFG